MFNCTTKPVQSHAAARIYGDSAAGLHFYIYLDLRQNQQDYNLRIFSAMGTWLTKPVEPFQLDLYSAAIVGFLVYLPIF